MVYSMPYVLVVNRVLATRAPGRMNVGAPRLANHTKRRTVICILICFPHLSKSDKSFYEPDLKLQRAVFGSRA